MNLLGIGDIVEEVGSVADDLFTSDEERLNAALKDKTIDADLQKGQMEVNKAEAKHKSIFVAGWRPFIGWVGGAALAYQFIVYPFLIWVWAVAQAKGWVPQDLSPPPMLDTGALFSVVTGMLGIGAMRSHDKRKGVQTDSLGVAK